MSLKIFSELSNTLFLNFLLAVVKRKKLLAERTKLANAYLRLLPVKKQNAVHYERKNQHESQRCYYCRHHPLLNDF